MVNKIKTNVARFMKTSSGPCGFPGGKGVPKGLTTRPMTGAGQHVVYEANSGTPEALTVTPVAIQTLTRSLCVDFQWCAAFVGSITGVPVQPPTSLFALPPVVWGLDGSTAVWCSVDRPPVSFLLFAAGGGEGRTMVDGNQSRLQPPPGHCRVEHTHMICLSIRQGVDF